jgi:hypothetical protein
MWVCLRCGSSAGGDEAVKEIFHFILETTGKHPFQQQQIMLKMNVPKLGDP